MMGVPGLHEAAQVEGEAVGAGPPCEEGGLGGDCAGTEDGRKIEAAARRGAQSPEPEGSR